MADINVSISSGSITVVEMNRGFSGYSGRSGFSGYSGANPGTSGYSGYSGKSGYSGISGKSGYSGVSGFSGYSGRSAYSGYSGVGTSGFSGYSGKSGYSGVSGYSGYSGSSKSMIGSVAASNGSNTIVAGSSTVYASAFNANYGTTGTNFFNATESLRQVRMPYACTLRNFYLDTNGAQAGDGTFVITVRKAGADTALTLTIGAGAAAGGFSDTTHSVSFNAGDLLSISFVNNGSTASAVLTSFSLEVDNP